MATPDGERRLIGDKVRSEPFLKGIAMPEPQKESEIEGVIVAAIEKHARGDVKALAQGIIEELRAAGFEIRRTPVAKLEPRS